MKGLALCGYSNTDTTAVLINDISTFELSDLSWITDGETPREPGRHLCGASNRHHFPSDVVLLIEDEQGFIPYNKGCMELLDDVWNQFREEERYVLNQN